MGCAPDLAILNPQVYLALVYGVVLQGRGGFLLT